MSESVQSPLDTMQNENQELSSSSSDVAQNQLPVGSSKKLGASFVMLVVLVLLLAGVKTVWPQYFTKAPVLQPTTSPVSDAISATPTPATSEPTDSTQVIDTTEGKDWVLSESVGGQKQVLARFPEHDSFFPLVSWQEWLFWGTDVRDDQGESQIEIHAHNTKTNEKITVYSLEDHLADFENQQSKGSRPSDLSQIRVIDNTLYFSLNGYMTPSATYWVNLPLTKQSQPKLLDPAGGSMLTQWGGYWWLISGFGDGCGGTSKFNLVDLQTHTTKFIARSSYGCAEGEEVIAVDPKAKRVIVADHIWSDSTSNNDADFGNITYTSVGVRSLDTPDTRMDLVSKDKMPANVGIIEYRAEINKIILHSPGTDYAVDPVSGTLAQTADKEPKVSTPQDDNYDSRPREKQFAEFKLPAGFSVELE